MGDLRGEPFLRDLLLLWPGQMRGAPCHWRGETAPANGGVLQQMPSQNAPCRQSDCCTGSGPFQVLGSLTSAGSRCTKGSDNCAKRGGWQRGKRNQITGRNWRAVVESWVGKLWPLCLCCITMGRNSPCEFNTTLQFCDPFLSPIKTCASSLWSGSAFFLWQAFFIVEMRVGIQGIRGAFHEEAALMWFGKEVEVHPCPDFPDMLDAVLNGTCSHAVMAVGKHHFGDDAAQPENSLLSGICLSWARSGCASFKIWGSCRDKAWMTCRKCARITWP